ncbi:hypothetical protein MUCCIDRAFT_136379 [Mucor lusitanicus CBS 277.49]|uniref:SEC7 domain-containing protein n=1 Tax=Mucor lusitanicus CBS 277.49 TaxID=747725 RepID=A0A168QEX9_MUCCL|nr:hypothetical protein MUCCIDRAFT_148188 [Mucor lusitanicus CBS 277.49]OAD09144.1 hypothetical protein MUCCIDRAFT_136379 [Mucor lusitanicus CBS 277.49]
MIAVTSAMRKNARWSGMGVNGLRMGSLGNSMGLHVQDIDAVNLLTPFLEVIRSGSTTGPIAGTALGSVEKLLHYGIVGVHNPRVSAAMNALSSAATHCKFEASDAASDELVLLRMLQVLQMAITSECGQVLSDEAVCEMMETGLSMCCQMRLSEMLRRSAEHVMINMVIAIFESTPKPSPSPTPQSTAENAAEAQDTPTDTEQEQAQTETHVLVESPKPEEIPQSKCVLVVEPTTLRAYGLPAIRELLRVLISLLNPHEHKHTDSMRLMALSILNVAFEVGGRSIGRFESLRTLITDDFCKFVFQLAKTDSTPLLAYSLRIITTVFDTLRPYLKLQQELFIFFLIERLSPTSGAGSRGVSVDVDDEGNISFVSMRSGVDADNSTATDVRSASPNMFLGKSTDYPRNSKGYSSSSEHMAITGEVRELLLESLVQFARKPTFMIDLWYNYDCDLTCGDLFEELIQFLSKNSFPDHQTYSLMSSHVLCLDTLLTFISQMMDRIDNQELDSVQDLLERKTRKRLILKGSRLFNESPKKGIKFLVENGVIEADESGDINASLSRFLRSTQQLDKKALGEYLGRPENVETLRAYMEQFNFSGKRMDEAMRMILETFRLPGESQQIMRVTEAFAATYFASGPKEIANIEAAEILAYSVIMLNVDQHSPQIRRQSRMSVEQYIRNVSGVNDKKDFPREYLVCIYEAIQQNEILMPEEHEGLLGFNYAWKQLQHRSTMCGQFIQCHTSTYDKAVFELSWKPVVAAISYVFNTAQDDDTLEKAITGFRQCASLAAHFELYDVFDSIIVNLATMTGLLENANGNTSVPDPIVDIAGQKYVVSKLAVRFGRNYKGQLAAVVMFTIVTRHGDSLRKGWPKILQIIRNLFLNSLLPSSMLQVEDFLSGTTSIPLKPKSPKPVKQTNRRDGSLLSTLSSYLLSPYSSDETYCRDPTDEEVESTMCAVDCIAVCKLEELFTDISSLQTDTLKSLLTAIRAVGYDTESMKKATITIAYDPATVLFLELMITITVRNADRIEELWPYATEYIFGILEFADKQSVLVVERTVVGLLRLCICSASRNVMLDEIVKCLRLLRDFPPTVTQAVAEQMMAGIFNLSSANSENRK